MLHILNGDATRAKLERSGVPGTFTVWADALHDGPVPPLEIGAERWREARARFADQAGWLGYDDALAMLARWDAGLERMAEHEEAVLWLEHDLFDQLLLIRHLAWLAVRGTGSTRLSLICIGEYPGVPGFKGLGELTPPQLASLFPARRPVSERQLDIGARAFAAFTASDPRALEQFIAGENAAELPFLVPALRRLLEEFPSSHNGLSRTEGSLLSLLAQEGDVRLGDLWRGMHATDSWYYVTNLGMRDLVRRFDGEQPLVTTRKTARQSDGDAIVRLTTLGREVLDGRRDWVRLRGGIDRWIGGTHLLGDDAAWRWHASAGRLVAADRS